MSDKVVYASSKKRSNKYIGSRLICYGTKHFHEDISPCSHLVIILRKTLVIESTMFRGVNIVPYSVWIKDNKVVDAFSVPYNQSLSNYIPNLLTNMWGKSYDWLGLLYFAWRVILNKYLNVKLPTVNILEDPNKRFCVEVFGDKLSMVSPIQMVSRWMSDENLTRIEWQD